MVTNNVLQGRGRAIYIEGAATVGNRKIVNSPGTEHAQMVGESSKWVLGVLDEVIGDDEVHRRVRLTQEGLTVVDDVHLDEGLGSKLRVVAA